MYVYDTVKPEQDEYDIPPRHPPPTQQDIYDVPPARQQYNTQVRKRCAMLKTINHPNTRHDAYLFKTETEALHSGVDVPGSNPIWVLSVWTLQFHRTVQKHASCVHRGFKDSADLCRVDLPSPDSNRAGFRNPVTSKLIHSI